MRIICVLLTGVVLAYLAGAFEAPLTLIRGSAGAVNSALTR